MSFKKTTLSFEETGSFSKVFTDYIKEESYLTPFYQYQSTLAGFKKAIEDRSKDNPSRDVLVKVLKEN
ncbi:MAG TPA: bacillithiol biosynthesis BshC, partial [Bacteroidia bacterium]|nr:bacillithiol biosynthesis BshC [Bacteroidia bacterium]